MQTIPTYPCVKVMPTYSVSYAKALLPYPKNNNPLPVLNDHKGIISDKASTKIRNAINWMLYFSKKKKVFAKKESSTFSFYLSFITLTLPSEQKHDDDFIKDKMVVPFLEWLCRTKGAKMYLWKAESQANGNIHFHITTHIFVHWKVVRFKWNKICAKFGYCKIFQDGSNDKGDSATQIKAAKNPEQVGGYLASYIGKNDRIKLKIKKPVGLPSFKSTTKSDDIRNYQYGKYSVLKRPIEGRLWACSTNLSKIDCTFTGYDDYEIIYKVFSDLDYLTEKTKKEKYYNIFMYRNLKFKKLSESITFKLNEISSTLNLHEKTNYIVESLFE